MLHAVMWLPSKFCSPALLTSLRYANLDHLLMNCNIDLHYICIHYLCTAVGSKSLGPKMYY